MRRAGCHPDRPVKGRGLCNACYHRARAGGVLSDHDKRQRSRDEFLDEYVMLRGEGLSLRLIGERLGMSKGGVYVAVLRARRAGDPRAFVWRAKRRAA